MVAVVVVIMGETARVTVQMEALQAAEGLAEPKTLMSRQVQVGTAETVQLEFILGR